MDAGVGGALVYIDLAARPSKAPQAQAAEAEGEILLVAWRHHTLCTILTWVAGLTGQELTVQS